MRRAMEYASDLGVVLAQHCENEALSAGGHMHEGEWSSRLGIPGQPAEAEELMVMRDIALARLTGATIHFQHLSTAGSIAMVRAAKAGGLPVSAEATPHHFTLTDAECASYDPVFKVNPPLRTASRRRRGQGRARRRLRRRHRHRPRPARAGARRSCPFDQAPPGMLGLETALALALTELELPARATCSPLLSWRPAAIAGVAAEHGGPIAEGRPANLCVIDTERDVDGRRRRPGVAGPATRPTPAGSSAAGSATPSCGASPSSSTARPSDEARRERWASQVTAACCARPPSCSPTGACSRARRSGPTARVAWPPGEVVFNTVLAGYQEVLSDPSYAGQIVTFTYPHIGNYGANADDDESSRPACRGVVVRDLARRRSNWRAEEDLDDWLRRHGVAGIAGVDTRRLTRHIRATGAMPGAFGTADEHVLKAAAAAEPGTDGVDLVATVTTAEPYTVGRRGPSGRRLRLRHQDDDPAPPVPHRHRRGRAGVDAGRRRARPRARRRVPLQRAGGSRLLTSSNQTRKLRKQTLINIWLRCLTRFTWKTREPGKILRLSRNNLAGNLGKWIHYLKE